jgi:hypothetical protein
VAEVKVEVLPAVAHVVHAWALPLPTLAILIQHVFATVIPDCKERKRSQSKTTTNDEKVGTARAKREASTAAGQKHFP